MEFVERDVDRDRAAMDDLRALGLRSVPVTVVGDTRIVGFRARELAEALGLALDPKPRDPAETIPLLDRLLVAVRRAVLQLPEDRLEYSAPDRDRPMREFACHIFSAAQMTVRGISTGALPVLDTAGQEVSGLWDQTPGRIAELGGRVIAELRTWAADQDPDPLRSPPKDAAGDKSGAELLDIIAGHTAHHLRQLYSVLESFGIEPVDRLPDSELPPEYVLTILW